MFQLKIKISLKTYSKIFHQKKHKNRKALTFYRTLTVEPRQLIPRTHLLRLKGVN